MVISFVGFDFDRRARLILLMDGVGSPSHETDPRVLDALNNTQDMYPGYTPSRNFGE
jgi:hypothetical protein